MKVQIMAKNVDQWVQYLLKIKMEEGHIKDGFNSIVILEFHTNQILYWTLSYMAVEDEDLQ